jgi:hypothetical protein
MASIDTRISNYRNKKPKDSIEWTTLEIYQETVGTFRFINEFIDKDLTLEAGAPRNAGETVTFKAISFKATNPAQDSEPQSYIAVTMQRVGSEVKSIAKQLDGFAGYAPAELIWRKYLSDDTSEPALIYYLYIESMSVDGLGVTIVATDENPNSQRVADIITTQRFPGTIDL